MRSARGSRIGERDWRTFGTGHRKWFTAGDASRGEAERGDTRSAARSSARGLRARFPLVSFLSVSLPLPLYLCLSFPAFIPPPCNAQSLSFSVSLSAPWESLENSVKVSSSRRVVSLWGFEGRVVSLSIPPPLLRSPSDARALKLHSASPRDGVVGARRSS